MYFPLWEAVFFYCHTVTSSRIFCSYQFWTKSVKRQKCCPKICFFDFYLYLCNVHTRACGRKGWDNDILESVIDALFLAI